MKDTAAELVLLPGTYDPASHAVAGPLTVEMIRQVGATKVFLGTELGLALAKHSRKVADPLAQKFYVKFEKLIKTPTPGFKYDQVYGLKTRKIINKEYLKP